MGGKRKPKSARFMSNGTTGPPTLRYQWSTQGYTLQDITKTFSLPRVVQCDVGTCTLVWSKFNFDLKQPLLIHSARSVKKVYARCLQFDPNSEQYIEFGPAIIIPSDYPGWFYVPSCFDDAPKLFTSIEEVANSIPQGGTFISTTRQMVFCLCNASGENIQHVRRQLIPGEHLQVGKTYIGCATRTSKITKKVEQKQVKYLKCQDDKNDQLIIPYALIGKFYEVSLTPSEDAEGKFVERVSSFIADEEDFPVVVRHVFGDLPSLPFCFTGLLSLQKTLTEQTVMATTLMERYHIPLEIAFPSAVKFQLALNDRELQESQTLAEASNFCLSNSDRYVKNMKVAFTLMPNFAVSGGIKRMPPADDVRNADGVMIGIGAATEYKEPGIADIGDKEQRLRIASTSDIDSDNVEDDIEELADEETDLSEIDANSEFHFGWNPKTAQMLLLSKDLLPEQQEYQLENETEELEMTILIDAEKNSEDTSSGVEV